MNQDTQSRICIHCGQPIDQEDAFCIHCGAKIEPEAPAPDTASVPEPDLHAGPVCCACGAELEPDDMFCTNCGAKQPAPSTEHTANRFTTIRVKLTALPSLLKSNRSLQIACAAVLLIALFAVGFLWGRHNKKASLAAKEVQTQVPLLSQDIIAEPPSLPDTGSDADSSDTFEQADEESQPEEDSKIEENSQIEEDSQTEAPEAGEPVEEPVVPAAEETSTKESYDNLYIGAWVPAGQTAGDEENGWQAVKLTSVSGNALTFTLESAQSAPSSRIAMTDPITVTLENHKATFPVRDSWGNSGTGEITVNEGAIHVQVSITSTDPTSLWDITMDADFYPETASSGSAAAAPQITGFGTTQEEIKQAFEYQSIRNGASFSVTDTTFTPGNEAATFLFRFGEAEASFSYRYDRSYGEISIGKVSNRSKLTELANAAFLILSESNDSTDFKSLPSEVFSTEATAHGSYYDEEAAAAYGDFYVETVADTYSGVYTVNGYECVFRLVHSYEAMQVGRQNDTYSGTVQFMKS